MNTLGTDHSLLAAGVFGSIGMLAWASVALVPLLLHLWNRRRHSETNWAAMEFLLAAIQEQSRRLRIEQLLLLLLRIAIPCVLAFALADPLWQLLPSQGSSLGSREPQHHLFLIDTSYSMEYEVDGETRLSQAQRFARDIIEDSPQGDGYTLLRMSSPSDAIVASPAYSKSDILAEVNALTTRDYVGDLASGLALAKQTIQSTRMTHPRLARHRLYIISDMRKNTWQEAGRPKVRASIADIESLAQVVVADVGVPQYENTAIVSVNRETALPVLGATMSWNVSLKSWASAEHSCEIEMRIDDRLTDKKTVQLNPDEIATASFSYQFDAAGQHVVAFHLPSDALPTDNQRYEVITIRGSIHVLCAEGRAGAARNVALALAPHDESNIQIRTVRDHRMGNLDLSSFDALFLCNVGSITTQLATQLRDFLRHGRGIVMFLGDQTQPQNHNGTLGQTVDGEPCILPVELLGVTPYSRYSFSPDDYRHPLIEPFRGQEQSGLLGTPVWSYMKMTLRENSPARIALAFSNGDPAIVEQSVLGGKFAVVATAPSQQSVLQHAGRSTPWNAWSVWPSFPPIVQELLTYAVAGVDDAHNVTVGQAIGAVIHENDVSDFVTIRDTMQSEHRVVVQDSLAPSWNWSETHRHGVYTARLADDDAISFFAVNLDSQGESEPDRVSTSELPRQFQQNSIEVSSDPTMNSALDSAPLFRQLLGLLLVLLIAESTVAWYFGRLRA